MRSTKNKWEIRKMSEEIKVEVWIARTPESSVMGDYERKDAMPLSEALKTAENALKQGKPEVRLLKH
jgi:hypothetical protein